MGYKKFKGKYRIASLRLKNWNYGNNGYYFITICTKNRKRHFGNISNNKMGLSEIGEIAKNKWNPGVLGLVINQYKRICTIESRKINPAFAWQARYYDRIIRDKNELARIRKYIIDNPAFRNFLFSI